MNRHSGVHKSLLELACRGGEPRIVDHRKVRRLGDQLRDLTEIFRFVCGDSNGAIGAKGTVQGQEEAIVMRRRGAWRRFGHGSGT